MSSAVNESLVGRVLDGRYRVLSQIAEGGMATIYLATDSRLERDVALKVMRPSLAQDEQFVARFRREARSAAQLSHPNVVSVFDQGEDDGNVFLAMEYVPGKTLREVMQQEGPLTPRAALDLLDSVLQALQAAHTAGIVHRDVKPENVILRKDGMVKVTDFGLARAVSSQTSTSQTGMLLGTVAYLSPEQVERGIADARSDVYAAGLVLFEMLTGTKAFTGETPIHVAYQHVHGDVPTPSSRVASVPPALDRLVARATSRDPDDRPADAGAFLAELRAARRTLSPAELDVRPGGDGDSGTAVGTAAVDRTASLPVTRATPPAARPAQRRRRGRWTWLVAALAMVLIVGAGLWYFVAGPGSPTVVPRVAGLSYAQAQQALQASHLRANREDSFSETVPKGEVVSSDPGAGQQTGRSTAVTLSVSKGPERYAVPKLAGSTQTEAENRLTGVSLALGTVTPVYSESVPQGQILSSDPPAGTSLKKGTAVAVVVSKGRQPIDVQDFTGKPADEAVPALTSLGLKVDATKQQNSDSVPKGSVISQSPSSGTAFKGDTITLVVSKGPQLVTVPDVQRKQVDEATKTLEAAGFKVTVQPVLGGIFGTVRSQDPAPGSRQPKGSTVTLLVV